MNNRRSFIKKFALSSAALLMAEKIHADPYQPLPFRNPNKNIIKVSGYVKSGGKGISNTAISDGISVVITDSNGFYSLLTDAQQQFVFISLPAGYSIPQNPTGTAKFYYEISNNKEEQQIDFELKKETSSDNSHSFLVLADPQTIDMGDINLMNTQTVPDVKKVLSGISTSVFGIGCGDIVFDNLALFPEYEKAVKEMGAPFFQVFGNHDAETLAKTDEVSVKSFRKYFGPNYYSFNKGEIHYVVLDDIFYFGDYIGYLTQPQLDWLENDLKFIEKGKTVVVFAHIPIYSDEFKRINEKTPPLSFVCTNKELLYKILEPYKAYLISGHTHESEYLTDGNCEIHICGTVCGAWWTGPICFDGTPNGYAIYNVNGTELKWQYKSVGKEMDHQMRLYKQDNSIIANVWNYNKNWKINMYEAGNKTIMKQTPGFDPLSKELYEGPDKPGRYDWIDPMFTDHLFKEELPNNVKEVTVEAIDQWGRIYKEKLSL